MLAAVATSLAVPFGCGLDDSAVVAIDSTDASLTDGFASGDESSITLGDGGNGDGAVCVKRPCSSYPSNCRDDLDDGCGGTLDCRSSCLSIGQACITDSGTCDGPPVCLDAGEPGGNCHTIVNTGNGLEAGCGECANPGYNCNATTSTCTCAGGPVCGANCCNAAAAPNCNTTNNTCCKLTTCAANTCNPTNDNGCGANLDCSANCTSGTACGTDHVCATPPTCTNKGANGGSCGTVAGTHGLTIDCGTCATAGYNCVSNICSCTAESMATTCGTNKCGMVNNNCGTPVDCGTCGYGDVCGAPSGGTCACSVTGDNTTCNSGQTCCKNMGNINCKTGSCF